MIDIKVLKSQLDLVAVVQACGVSLKRKGTNYFALCVFHTESTPSLSVNPRTQLFHCFGCGTGGDVFRFVERYYGIRFGAAVAKLNAMLAGSPELRRAS